MSVCCSPLNSFPESNIVAMVGQGNTNITLAKSFIPTHTEETNSRFGYAIEENGKLLPDNNTLQPPKTLEPLIESLSSLSPSMAPATTLPSSLHLQVLTKSFFSESNDDINNSTCNTFSPLPTPISRAAALGASEVAEDVGVETVGSLQGAMSDVLQEKAENIGDRILAADNVLFDDNDNASVLSMSSITSPERKDLLNDQRKQPRQENVVSIPSSIWSDKDLLNQVSPVVNVLSDDEKDDEQDDESLLDRLLSDDPLPVIFGKPRYSSGSLTVVSDASSFLNGTVSVAGFSVQTTPVVPSAGVVSPNQDAKTKPGQISLLPHGFRHHQHRHLSYRHNSFHHEARRSSRRLSRRATALSLTTSTTDATTDTPSTLARRLSYQPPEHVLPKKIHHDVLLNLPHMIISPKAENPVIHDERALRAAKLERRLAYQPPSNVFRPKLPDYESASAVSSLSASGNSVFERLYRREPRSKAELDAAITGKHRNSHNGVKNMRSSNSVGSSDLVERHFSTPNDDAVISIDNSSQRDSVLATTDTTSMIATASIEQSEHAAKKDSSQIIGSCVEVSASAPTDTEALNLSDIVSATPSPRKQSGNISGAASTAILPSGDTDRAVDELETLADGWSSPDRQWMFQRLLDKAATDDITTAAAAAAAETTRQELEAIYDKTVNAEIEQTPLIPCNEGLTDSEKSNQLLPAQSEKFEELPSENFPAKIAEISELSTFENKKIFAVLRIQRAWRRAILRSTVANNQKSTVETQIMERAKVARKNFARDKVLLIRAQAFAQACKKLETIQAAAKLIQFVVRQFLRKRAACRLQQVWRKYKAKSNVLTYCQHADFNQTLSRKLISQKKVVNQNECASCPVTMTDETAINTNQISESAPEANNKLSVNNCGLVDQSRELKNQAESLDSSLDPSAVQSVNQKKRRRWKWVTRLYCKTKSDSSS